jgi:hypothetical protein
MTTDDATPELPLTLAHEPTEAAMLELARKNLRWGWALFGLFLVLFGGTVGVAFVYLWLD